MRYWWVNHKQTSKQELAGGYLWSPVREASGARSQFYDNMRIAEPGDAVLSFAGGAIQHVGRVADFASPAPKPDSFGTVGEYWSKSGLLLAPHVDRLFDKGFISFTDAGQVLVSPKLDRADLEKLGLLAACMQGCNAFSERHAPYLGFHRENVFLR